MKDGCNRGKLEAVRIGLGLVCSVAHIVATSDVSLIVDFNGTVT